MSDCVVGQHCLVYSRHYCNRPLRWHVVQDPCDPSKAPDVVFDDITFNPLLTDPNTSVLKLLDRWESNRCSLAALLGLLVEQYTQHQKDRIAALGDERMLFELAMLEDLACSEVLLAVGPDGSQQACFAIPVAADLAPAEKLTKFLQDGNSSSSHAATEQQQQQQQQQEDGQQQQQQFMLHVAFKVGPGVSSHAAPDLQLQSPAWTTQYLPPLPLPTWDPQTSLVEYVPHLAEKLNKHLQDHCPAAVVRFELITALSEAFGPPLEVNMQCSAIRNAPSTAGGNSSIGHLAAAAGKGRGSSSAVFQIMYEQQPLLLFVELTAAFPADAPLLMIQSLSRLGPSSCCPLNHVPWSPRWDAAEMAARLFNFVKQQGPQTAVKEAVPGSTGSVL